MVCRAEKIIRLAPKTRTCIHQYRRVRLFGTNRIILSALEFNVIWIECRRGDPMWSPANYRHFNGRPHRVAPTRCGVPIDR